MKKTLILIPIILLLLGGYLAYFFIANDAPIIKGKVISNVEFKPGLSLDVYNPTVEVYGRNPVVIFYHGGAWIGGSKESVNINRFNHAINELRKNGFAVVSPNYTLARNGQSPFPACIEDGFDALFWVTDHAEEYGFDLDNVGVFGESAGAHIAMSVGYAKPSDFGIPRRKPKLEYVVDVYGPNHLERMYHMQTMDSINALLEKLPPHLQECLDIAQHLFGFDPDQDTLRAEKVMTIYSPINYLDAEDPYTLMIHGDVDQIVPLDQSTLLKEKLDSLGVTNDIKILEGVNHAFSGATQQQKTEMEDLIAKTIMRNYSGQLNKP
ncbi:MAG: alpha/beta hydrolase [Cyclobacteriaceae bacterium]